MNSINNLKNEQLITLNQLDEIFNGSIDKKKIYAELSKVNFKAEIAISNLLNIYENKSNKNDEKTLTLRNIAKQFQHSLNNNLIVKPNEMNEKIENQKSFAFSPNAQEFVPQIANRQPLNYYYSNNYISNQECSNLFTNSNYNNHFPNLLATEKKFLNQSTPIVQHYHKPLNNNPKKQYQTKDVRNTTDQVQIGSNKQPKSYSTKTMNIKKENVSTILSLDKAIKLTKSYLDKNINLLILMRGCPGSGKSTMARELKHNGVVLSSDDFFLMDSKYIFQPDRLHLAHEHNQCQTLLAMKSKLSPIIIDNTNTQMWEMLPYAKMAYENKYSIEIIEPNLEWRLKPKKLAKLNSHGVDLKKVKLMMDRYEHNISVKSLMQAANSGTIARKDASLNDILEKRPQRTVKQKHSDQATEDVWTDDVKQTDDNINIGSSNKLNINKDAIECFNKFDILESNINDMSLEITPINVGLEDKNISVTTIKSNKKIEESFGAVSTVVDIITPIESLVKTGIELTKTDIIDFNINHTVPEIKLSFNENPILEIDSNTLIMQKIIPTYYAKKEMPRVDDDLIKEEILHQFLDVLNISDDKLHVDAKDGNQIDVSKIQKVALQEADNLSNNSDNPLSDIQPCGLQKTGEDNELLTDEDKFTLVQACFPLIEEEYLRDLFESCNKDVTLLVDLLSDSGYDCDADLTGEFKEQMNLDSFCTEGLDVEKETDLEIVTFRTSSHSIKPKAVFVEKDFQTNLIPLSNEGAKGAAAIGTKHIQSWCQEVVKESADRLNEESNCLPSLQLTPQLLEHLVQLFGPINTETSVKGINYNIRLDIETSKRIFNLWQDQSFELQMQGLNAEFHQKENLLLDSFNGQSLATKIKRKKLMTQYPFIDPKVIEDIFISSGYSIDIANKMINDSPELIKSSRKSNIEETKNNDSEKCNLSYEQLLLRISKNAQLQRNNFSNAREGLHRKQYATASFYLQKAQAYKELQRQDEHLLTHLKLEKRITDSTFNQTLDLHEMCVREVIQCLPLAVEKHEEGLRARPDKRRAFLFIVTGRGLHSAGGVPKLKPVVIKYLTHHNYQYVEATPGILKIKLKC